MIRILWIGLLGLGLAACAVPGQLQPEAFPMAAPLGSQESSTPAATETKMDGNQTSASNGQTTDPAEPSTTAMPDATAPAEAQDAPETAAADETVTSEEIAPPAETPLPGQSLFRFVEGEAGWYIVDDDVMGGRSNSRATIVEGNGNGTDNANILRFFGTMSLENNGGFSSVRSDWQPIDLSGTDGILLRVLGDGKAYRLRIRSTETGPNVTYNALFQTTPDAWQLVYIPYDGMVPTLRGFRMDVGPLDPAKISAFGFMLSDKQPGEFALAVNWIRAVSEAEIEALANGQEG